MTDHLSDEQLTAALLEEVDAPIAEHLSRCEPCRQELEAMRTPLSSLRADALALAERPPLFWREQRLAIASQIPTGREVTTRPLAWAGSFAIFALAAAWMTYSAAPTRPSAARVPSPAAVSVPADPDHDLLVDIQRSVRREVPLALEPATLLAQELHAAANRRSDR